MRKLVLIAVLAPLSGCAAYVEGIEDTYGDYFKTRAEREAGDMAYCQRLGAMPGTDIFIQCVVGRAQVRATSQQ